MTTQHRRSTATIATLLAAGALLGACGGEAAETSAGTPASAQDDLSAFAECMREQGVDVPDPSSTGEGGTRFELPEGVSPQQLSAAQRRCERHLPDRARAESDLAQAAEFQDTALAFAQCMHKQGIDFPDPSTQGGPLVMSPETGVDPGDPAVRRAQERCRSLLPEPRR